MCKVTHGSNSVVSQAAQGYPWGNRYIKYIYKQDEKHVLFLKVTLIRNAQHVLRADKNKAFFTMK